MKVLRILLILFFSFIALPVMLLRLAAIGIAILNGDVQNINYMAGQFVGTLLVCVFFAWLIKYFWKRNKLMTPPKLPKDVDK